MTQIIANGIRLEFEQYGDELRTPIILVRGLGTQLIDWPVELVQGLVKEGFRVIVFDNRDVGLSEKFEGLPDLGGVARGEQEPPYRLEDMAGDIVGLMDSLEVRQAYLFAISMGGMIGQVMAANHGERLLGFFSVMSSSGRKGLPDATTEAKAILEAETEPDAGTDEIIQVAAEGLRICGSPGYPMSADDRLAIVRNRLERNYTPEGVVRQMAAVLAGRDRAELLESITVPTMVIHGEDDPLVPVEHGIDTANSIHGASIELVPGMGHDLPPALMHHMVDVIVAFTGHPI